MARVQNSVDGMAGLVFFGMVAFILIVVYWIGSGYTPPEYRCNNGVEEVKHKGDSYWKVNIKYGDTVECSNQ